MSDPGYTSYCTSHSLTPLLSLRKVGHRSPSDFTPPGSLRMIKASRLRTPSITSESSNLHINLTISQPRPRVQIRPSLPIGTRYQIGTRTSKVFPANASRSNTPTPRSHFPPPIDHHATRPSTANPPLPTMSSPAASDASARPKKDEQITFRFCSECSNMLYPKEDEVNHKLMFECRTCAYTEEAASTCIFRHDLSNSAGETAGVTQDVGSDPTVGTPHLSGSTPSACASSSARAPPLARVLCVHCGDVIRCRFCRDVLVQERAGITDEVEDGEDEIDYDYPDEDIDESSEESLVETLTTTGMILDEEELLWYAGETSQRYEDEDDDQPMEDYFTRPICL